MRDHIPLLVTLIFGVVATFIVVIAVKGGNKRDVQRQAALTEVAAQMGLSFTTADSGLLLQYGGYAFIQHADVPRAMNIMWGTRDVPVVLFDYDVTTGSRNNRTLVRMTVAAFDASATPLPVFEAEGGRQDRYTRLVDKVLGEKGIDFSDDPDFARAFVVTGADANAVQRVFSADARRLLLRHSEWMCRSTGRWLLMCWIGKRPTPAEFPAFVEEASAVMRAMTGAGA